MSNIALSHPSGLPWVPFGVSTLQFEDLSFRILVINGATEFSNHLHQVWKHGFYSSHSLTWQCRAYGTPSGASWVILINGRQRWPQMAMPSRPDHPSKAKMRWLIFCTKNIRLQLLRSKAKWNITRCRIQEVPSTWGWGSEPESVPWRSEARGPEAQLEGARLLWRRLTQWRDCAVATACSVAAAFRVFESPLNPHTRGGVDQSISLSTAPQIVSVTAWWRCSSHVINSLVYTHSGGSLIYAQICATVTTIRCGTFSALGKDIPCHSLAWPRVPADLPSVCCRFGYSRHLIEIKSCNVAL